MPFSPSTFPPALGLESRLPCGADQLTGLPSPAPTMGVMSAQPIFQPVLARTRKLSPGGTGGLCVSPQLLNLTSNQSWPGFSSCPSLNLCPLLCKVAGLD